MGYHTPGVVHICAWEDGLWWHDTDLDFYEERRDIVERLGVISEKRGGRLILKWTESHARAFQLLHILLHELGHHHDRMTTTSQREAARGEPYAEHYARKHGEAVWDRYLATFGLD